MAKTAYTPMTRFRLSSTGVPELTQKQISVHMGMFYKILNWYQELWSIQLHNWKINYKFKVFILSRICKGNFL